MKTEQDRASRTSAYDEFIAYVMRHIPCDACGEAYGLDDVRVLHHDDFQWALAATCPVCAQNRSVTAYEYPPYVRLLERRLTTPVERRDVADWSAFLAGFEGDMADLLEDLD